MSYETTKVEKVIIAAMLFFAIAVVCCTVFAQSTVDEDTVHFVGQASAFTLGSQFVENDEFTGNADGWTLGTWTYAANAVSEDNAGADSDLLQNIEALIDGRLYRLQFEVTVYTDGNVTAVFDGVEVGDKSAVGTYTAYVVAVGTDADLIIRADATFTGTIDNVKLYLWPGHATPGGGSTAATYSGTLTDYMSATGGVLHNASGLAMSNSGGSLAIAAATTWDTTPQVGGLVNCDFSATFTDGVYEITAASTSSITIDLSSGGLGAETVEVWIGGAFPDIATAVASGSTLTEDPDGVYRKRNICVNVDNVVDAALDFVAETSEQAMMEDGGSRKIIGFYDSISTELAGLGYRVISDIDEGQTYYSGARKAFNQDESFTTIRPDGKWIEWDANDNATSIIEINTSNFEMRNIKAHNNVGGVGIHGVLYFDDATKYNTTLINCWFAAVNDFVRNDQASTGNSVVDCYFEEDIADLSLIDFRNTYFLNCIFDGTSRSEGVNNFTGGTVHGCIFYKGGDGLTITSIGTQSNMSVINSIFSLQTTSCIKVEGQARVLATFTNNIFDPAAITDFAIDISAGSITSAGFNNIMYCTAADAVLTVPVNQGHVVDVIPLPIGTLEVNPQFINDADGDFRLQLTSPGLNAGHSTLFGGKTSIGAWQPNASTSRYRARYNPGIYD